MRVTLFLALLLAPVAVSAQLSTPANTTYNQNQGNLLVDRGISYASQDRQRASLRNIGAWSRCVVAADADGVRTFLRTSGVAYRRAEWDLKPVFYDCAREVGAPTLFTQDRFRTAALIDALNAGRPS